MQHFKAVLFIALSLYMISCAKKESSAPTPTPSPTNDLHTVRVSKSSITADDFEESIISVLDKNGNDVTVQSSLTINGNAVTDTKFRTKTTGTFSIIAKLQNVNSAAVTINATDPGLSKYTQRALLEKYTGAWCGNCPRVAYKVNQTAIANNKVIPVFVHTGDAFNFPLVSNLQSAFGASGVPSVVVNRNATWTDNQSSWTETVTPAISYTSNWAPLGLSIQSTVAGTTISGTVKTEFNVNTTRAMKVVIMLVEDGVVASQQNYYNTTAGSPLAGLGAPIASYSHKNILRQVSTNLFGDVIPAAQVVKNNIYDKSFTFNASGIDVNKAYIIASVVYEDNQAWKGVINAQIVKAGQNVAFN